MLNAAAPPAEPGSRRKWRIRLLVFAYFTATGLLLFGYRALDDVARAHSRRVLTIFIEEMTGAYAALLLLPFLVRFARRYRIQKSNWLRRVPAHLAAMAVFSFMHTSLMALSRQILFPLVGLGSYDYGIMRFRYLMEFSNDVIVYCLFVGFVYLFDHYRQSRDREVQTAQLETQLAQAQLQALRLQLQPHFLFNAMNTISSLVYDNPRAADEMIARLSDLLRLTMRDAGAQEVTLEQELKLLDLYLDIMRARFEERLTVHIECEADLHRALVPQLVLQPLVENCIRHAADPETGVVQITVHARRDSAALLLEVSDSGPGVREQLALAKGNGIGLTNTAERLRQLYGEPHGLSLANGEGKGLTVTLRLPLRENAE
ncbi:MAG: two-component system, LytTR family, sensor kinase [Blastocatellia bacterium]